MNQYPPASKRKYKSTTTYRDFTIAVYYDPNAKPLFEIGDVPTSELFFVLDDMGENVLPIDVPLSSVFHAFAAIDMYHRCNNDDWRQKNPSTPLWTYIQENVRAGFKFVALLDFLRKIQGDLQAFEPDPEFGDDPAEWRDRMIEDMKGFFSALSGHRPAESFTLDSEGRVTSLGLVEK